MELLTEELSPAEFKITNSNCIKFSRQGSVKVPYSTTDFEWKDYCPGVFRRLLEFDNIDYDYYRLAICGDATVRGVSSPGTNGKVFLLSRDDRFVIQTMRKSELKVYLELLPNYYRHARKFRSSLLVKLYGLHGVRPVGGTKVYFAVWARTMPTEVCIHKCYDLKGSSIGRACTKLLVDELHVLKDMEFDFCFYLDPIVRARLLAQIKHDCEFLEAQGIMDYSLLIGIHKEGSFDLKSSRSSSFVQKKSYDSSEEESNSELTLADICDRLDRPGFKFGESLPARAYRTFRNEESKSYKPTTRSQEGFNVLLFFGIIDFCQTYNMKKRLEHACKAIKYDPKTIKTVNPKVYASRFQEFLSEVFLAEETD